MSFTTVIGSNSSTTHKLAARGRQNPTIQCKICGDYVTKYNYSNHSKTRKHMRLQEALQKEEEEIAVSLKMNF